MRRYSEHSEDLCTGMMVMVNLPEDGVWYRAIVADPCVGDQEVRSSLALRPPPGCTYLVWLSVLIVVAVVKANGRTDMGVSFSSFYWGFHTALNV